MKTHRQQVEPDKRLRVIIAEDAPHQAELLQLGLQHAGFVVDVVTNGLDAVDQIEVRHYDAAVIDYQMPGVDGFAAARLLGDSLGRIARPVMIALTATPDKLNDRLRKDKKTFDIVLDKSCGLAVIVETIARLVAIAPNAEVKIAEREKFCQQQEEIYFQLPDQPKADEQEIAQPMILIVEDDKSQRQLLSAVMEACGYRVDTTDNGLVAFNKINHEHYDLAIIDQNLPEIDGSSLALLVHNRMAQSARPRLIAFTASPDRLEYQEAVQGPVFDSIVGKLSGVNTLVAKVDSLLRNASNPATRQSALSKSAIRA